MPPLVSILIPCYNADRWLAETIESALAQTWKNKEIIIVDDGSTDESLAIARSYGSKQVKVITQDNQGASTARNVAYQNCIGDYIQYLDADDLLSPDKIDRQLGLLANFPNTIATCEWARFHHNPEEAQFAPQAVWQDFKPVDFLVALWEYRLMMHPAAWLVPRSIAEKAGKWNEELSLNDDGEYFARVVLASQEVKFCWGAKSYYRSGNLASLSASNSYLAWKSALKAIDLSTDHLLAKEDSIRTRQVCATVLQRLIYEIYPDAPDLIQQAEAKVQLLGGSDFPFSGGPALNLIIKILGWQRARKLQKIVYRYGYRGVAIGRHLQKITQNQIYKQTI
jgi:glycosyltransferase involved in cell wall biosynthesis